MITKLEEPLPAGGSCLLGSFNLSAYVNDGCFNFSEFEKDIHTVVKGMNEVLDEGLSLHPLQIQKDTVRDYRQIGIGVMGIADLLIKLGLKYGSKKSIDFCDVIGFILATESLYASSLLAEKYGAYPKYKECVKDSDFLSINADPRTMQSIEKHGLRNSQILTIAPTGSLSTMLGISGGIEPIFENSYTRKTESLHGEDVYYKVYTPIVKEYMDEHNIKDEKDLPDYFVTAMSLDPFKRVDMQSIWQKHIDASISSTINLSNDATVENVYDIYKYAWGNKCKGLTIYRDKCKREGVLTIGDNSNIDEEGLLNRGDWKPLASDTYYVKRDLIIGCGKLKLFIGFSPSENTVQDLYIVKSGNGGCTRNLQALAISMSAVLRLGGTLHNLERAFKGIDPCTSFASARAKGNTLSKGTYCGGAILNEINEFLKGVEGNVPHIENKKNKVNTNVEQSYANCPECGARINQSGGCVICPECGYTKCD